MASVHKRAISYRSQGKPVTRALNENWVSENGDKTQRTTERYISKTIEDRHVITMEN